MNGSDVFRLFATLRHLRAEQFIYRLYYRLCRRLVCRRAMRPLGVVEQRAWHTRWTSPEVAEPSLLSEGEFLFLGEYGEVRTAADWNSSDKQKLWLYNLHYLDDLNARGAEGREDLHVWLIDRWIDDNPPMYGNGWEPYTLALRVVNLVKWLSRSGRMNLNWLESLARQTQALYVQEERHLLANHLFVDGKALVFAGAFFGGESGSRWLDRGLKIVDEEMPGQFMRDGGNFELSPMYHASLLWDVCDLIRLGQVSGLSEINQRVDQWRRVVTNGVRWLQAMCHPDGGISFFNDAAFGIAPTLAEIKRYAEKVGCVLPESPQCRMSLCHLKETGYAVIDWFDGARAIVDVGEVGPSYQPGHAHADSLSYEWSFFGQRVLVNSGTSQYGEDAERQRQRGTRAHNTVMINEVDSSEVWAGFRVARRAYPIDLEVTEGEGRLRVECSHDGYHRLPSGVTHRRTWEATPQSFRIADSISGRFSSAVSRVHLHPDVRVTSEGALLLKGGQRLNFKVTGGAWTVCSTTWHPGFGLSIPNSCIEISINDAESAIEFTWN